MKVQELAALGQGCQGSVGTSFYPKLGGLFDPHRDRASSRAGHEDARLPKSVKMWRRLGRNDGWEGKEGTGAHPERSARKVE